VSRLGGIGSWLGGITSSRSDRATRYGSEGLEEDARKALELLARHGADLTQPLEVQHYLHFPDEAAAEAGQRDAEHLDVLGQVLRPKEGKKYVLPWTVVLQHEMVVSVESLLSWREHLVAVAERHGGEYDGWEASP